jgi:dTDP-4-dehydrorhamnose 3,5-epimerase
MNYPKKPYIYSLKQAKDNRGYLLKIVPSNFNNTFKILDFYISNSFKNVFRGLHYQTGQFTQNKLFTVLNGEMMFYSICSSTNKIFKQKISSHEATGVFVPIGWATGFHALSQNTTVACAADNFYSRESESLISYKKLNICESSIILSAKDNF